VLGAVGSGADPHPGQFAVRGSGCCSTTARATSAAVSTAVAVRVMVRVVVCVIGSPWVVWGVLRGRAWHGRLCRSCHRDRRCLGVRLDLSGGGTAVVVGYRTCSRRKATARSQAAAAASGRWFARFRSLWKACGAS
jgi:hypothetical protein